MAETYYPLDPPEEYDPVWLADELRRISAALAEMEVEVILLVPQGVEPSQRTAGMIACADGSSWDPGSGFGLYEWTGTAWRKL